NILAPVVSVITRIDFDHENFLGHSLREIATEKAGIIKKNVPVVIAPQVPEAREVLLGRAEQLASDAIETAEACRVEGLSIEDGCVRGRVVEVASGWATQVAPQLAGRFQLENALNAVGAARFLQRRGYRIPDSAIAEGIAATTWPGRLERL